MASIYGKYGPTWPRLGSLSESVARSVLTSWLRMGGVHSERSRFARSRIAAMREQLATGKTVYLAGLGTSTHNSGIALVEASARDGIRLLSNDEEERFTGDKHCAEYPARSIDSFQQRLAERGLQPSDIHACLTSWDFSKLIPLGVRLVFEHLPRSLPLLKPSCTPKNNFFRHFLEVPRAARQLEQQLKLDGGALPLIGMSHHTNHAAFSYGLSPFNHSEKPVLVTVLDGFGDTGAISLFVAENGQLRCLRDNASFFDSLGIFYAVISSTQGGWTSLSSEGRYMGAAAWGDGDRLTNPYYRGLRQIFYFGTEGQLHVNRAMVNWHFSGERQPYGKLLRELLGDPISPEKMWNPDAVLRVDDVEHSPVTRDRCDLAAATQLVFEDALFHIVEHLIRSTQADQLVLTGGTALNCIANMRLVERFDEKWYQRNLGLNTRLHIWVPPTPGDAGAAAGAAFNFALQAGACPGPVLQHAFYCGRSPKTSEIEQALKNNSEIGYCRMGCARSDERLEAIADFAAYVVARDGVVGFFQGPAETGPRALGHRSIVANPCNPNTLENINSRVKFRERIRPLAPMATLEAAQHFFELSPGSADDNFNAYNYMVLTAQARPAAYVTIPAVIHHDGTARVQIVRREHDPFTYAYLKAMGRHLSVEVSVNTSLNVGSPIVQSPEQALVALKKAKALTALLMIADDGETFLAWHQVDQAPKDAGRQLLTWLKDWQNGHTPEKRDPQIIRKDIEKSGLSAPKFLVLEQAADIFPLSDSCAFPPLLSKSLHTKES